MPLRSKGTNVYKSKKHTCTIWEHKRRGTNNMVKRCYELKELYRARRRRRRKMRNSKIAWWRSNKHICNEVKSRIKYKVVSVGTPPSEKHVARTSQWHVTRIIIRTTTIRIPLKICMRQFSYPDHFKEKQKTFQLLLSKEEQTTLAEHRYPNNLHNASAPQYIRIISMCHPDMVIRMTK